MEPAGVSGQQPLHTDNQIPSRSLEHQMKMVGHQAETMHLPIGLGAGLSQGAQEQLTVLGVAKDNLAMIATVHRMVNCSRVLDTQLASHERGFSRGLVIWQGGSKKVSE